MTLFTLSLRSIFTIGLLYFTYAAFATITIGEITPASAGACDGSIQVIANGDAGPFDLYVSGSNSYLSFKSDLTTGQHTFTGLCGGGYTITVINAYMCETTLNTTVSCPLTFQKLVTESCTGSGSGSITITPQDGTAPYTYIWKNRTGATAGGNTTTINNLPPDRYFVTITDANGCKATGDFSTVPTGEHAIYPYIKKVEVYALVSGTETLIYQAEWVLTAAGCIKYTGGSLPISLAIFNAFKGGTAGMRVEATANKELLDLDVFVGSNTPSQKQLFGSSTWKFTFSNIDLNLTEDGKINQVLAFLGEDNDGNEILEPLFRAAEVSSYLEFVYEAKSILIAVNNDIIIFEPYKNLGEKQGFIPIGNKAIQYIMNEQTVGKLGKCILKCFELAE